MITWAEFEAVDMRAGTIVADWIASMAGMPLSTMYWNSRAF